MRRVSVKNLQVGMVLAKPVYSSSGAMLVPVSTELTQLHIDNLNSRGIYEVWIVDKRMEDVEIEDAVSETLKIKLLQTIRSVYQKAEKAKLEKKVSIPISIMNSLISDLLDELSASKNKVLNIFPSPSKEHYLPVHIVNVAMLSLSIGRAYGLADRNLFDLGIGSLLFDIGMAFVPDEIDGIPNVGLDKLEILKNHTEEGFKALQQNSMISATAQSIALQHHEKFDGSGYPKGLKEDQVSLFARIVSVADVYDSLLCDRPNRQKYQPHEAYEYIITAGGFDFDLDIIQAFTRCVAPYPVGTMVELNTGEQGVVSKVEWGLATRPIIRLFYDKDKNPITGKVDLNLVEKPSILIDKIIES